MLWDAGIDASVIPIAAHGVSRADSDAFDLAMFADIATVVLSADGRQQVALSDGYRRIRFDVALGSVIDGPVRLDYLLGGFDHIEGRILTLRRFVSLRKTGTFTRGLFAPERLAPRWVAALRAYDAFYAGATQREIAGALFGAVGRGSDWRQRSDFLRLRVQRLVRIGRHMARGGYRTLFD
jgi:hypothetical protein